MAKGLWLIRHGESTANAGLAHAGGVETPLTEKGRRRAHGLPTIERLPSVQFEEQPGSRGRPC